MNILKETKNYIVALKPVGVLSEEDGNKKSMPLLLKNYLQEEQGVKDPKIFTVHRLDRDVGGVMVFAKNSKTASFLSSRVKERDIEKEYLAVVKGTPSPSEGILEDLLFRDSKTGKTYIAKRERAGVRDARLSYEVLASKETDEGVFSLVKVNLYTGRTHQIRVQFASRKWPLVGDRRYGSGDTYKSPALFSYHLMLKDFFDVVAYPEEECFPFSLFDIKNLLSKRAKENPQA